MGPLNRPCPVSVFGRACSQTYLIKVAFIPSLPDHEMLELGWRRGEIRWPPSSLDKSLAVAADGNPQYCPSSRCGAMCFQYVSASLGTTITVSVPPGWPSGPASEVVVMSSASPSRRMPGARTPCGLRKGKHSPTLLRPSRSFCHSLGVWLPEKLEVLPCPACSRVLCNVALLVDIHSSCTSSLFLLSGLGFPSSSLCVFQLCACTSDWLCSDSMVQPLSSPRDPPAPPRADVARVSSWSSGAELEIRVLHLQLG